MDEAAPLPARTSGRTLIPGPGRPVSCNRVSPSANGGLRQSAADVLHRGVTCATGVRRARVALVTVSLVLLAGCGSTHSTTTSAGKPAITHAAFTAQANAICAHLNEQEAPLRARAAPLESTPSATAETQSAPIMEQVVALARTADGKLAALPRPPQDAAAFDKLLSGFSEEATQLHIVALAFKAHEPKAWEYALGSLGRVHERDRAASLALGLRACTE